ncbi:nucleotidyltransferase family protein [Candidatus Kaiserbacteria bacterium]|nr:nucleotidyltransferase family protein [Candidatus Kaiserbacteria bacterium]
MQCVILAAGRGTRMDELTMATPKPMLPVAGRPLLEYKIDALPEECDEVILIVGYLKDAIKRHFGAIYGGRKVRYVEQDKLNGTAGALWAAKEVLHDRFLVMMGDDIYTKEDIETCIEKEDAWTLLVQQLPEMHRAGIVRLDENGRIVEILESSIEDADRLEPGLASTNLYVLDTRLFSCPLIPKHTGSLEYGLPQTVVNAAHTLGIPFEPVFTDKWIQITSPKDLVVAGEMLKKINQ